MRSAAGKLALLVLALAVALAAWVAWFTLAPLSLPHSPFEFTVRTGASLKSVSRHLADDALLPDANTLWILARLLGRAGTIQAGTYRLDEPLTPLELLDKLARGDVVALDVAFIEGTTFRQWLAQLHQAPHVRDTLAGKDEAEVKSALGLGDQPPEGWFFPDTYRFTPGVSDVEILRRAHATMRRRLSEGWAARDPGLALATPYEALILASIVEKETAVGAERPLVASVFLNRLKVGMRLQTDPTVIYGLGAAYDGNLRKKDLLADTPWNTYTRDGLPPTPIAMPGAAALQAALHPAETRFLYFVARGDGSHQFSRTLEEHNRAVARYQLGK